MNNNYKKINHLQDNIEFLSNDAAYLFDYILDKKSYEEAVKRFGKDYEKLQNRVNELKKANVL